MINLILISLLIFGYQQTICQEVFERTGVNSLLEAPDDIDMWRDTPTLILSRGFKVETHHVVTEDGYILTMFRIINPSADPAVDRPPVYLQHGGLSHSDVWIVNSMGQLTEDGDYFENDGSLVNDCDPSLNSTGNTIGFVLAVCGYDVWLGNFRGNGYSDQHLRLTIKDAEYWNFTVTELALYDITAMVDHIIQVTDYEKISYVGHSIGQMAMFMLLSLEPSFAERIKVFIAISALPLGSDNFNQQNRILFKILPINQLPLDLLNFPILFSPKAKFNTLIDFLCNPIIGNGLCQLITQNDLNPLKFRQTKSRVKSNFVHSLDRFGLKALLHGLQMINAGRFQLFDFGCFDNLIRYKSCQVPVIQTNRIRLEKIAVFYWEEDQLTEQKLEQKLGIELWRQFEAPAGYGHYDHLLNFEAGAWSVPRILQFLNEAHRSR